jgi:hypothetical protein
VIPKETKIAVKTPRGRSFDGLSRAILKKGMQGLKQASKIWGEEFHQEILSLDSRLKFSIKAGKCLYAMWGPDRKQVKLILIRFVDDLVGFSSDNNKTLDRLFSALNDKFPLKILGDMKKVLGIEVEYGHDCILLRQQKNILHCMEEFMVDELVKRVPSTPLSSDKASMLLKHDEPQQAEMHLPYRNGMGQLGWITQTRPDLAAAARILATYSNGYDEDTYLALLGVFKYANATRNLGILIRKTEVDPHGPFVIHAYADASHASCQHTKRSMSGGLIYLWGNLIDWSARMQKVVATSSAESELMAATEVTKDVQFYRHLIQEIGGEVLDHSRIHLDSEGAIFIASTDKTSSNIRHVAVRHFYCREAVENGDVEFGHVDGIDNPADMLTKCLDRVKLNQYIGAIMGSTDNLKSE